YRYDFGNEGEGDLLHLCQSLKESNPNANHHRSDNGRTRCDDDRPNGRLNNIEGVCLIHGQATITPGPSITSRPSANTAIAPPEMMRIAVTSPVMLPSTDVIVRPMIPSACASEIASMSESNFAFVCTACSTLENAASCAMYSVDSMGCVGS